MSRKKALRDADAFELMNQSTDTSAAAIDAELFGAIQKSDTHRQSASPVSIHDIYPDPAQPRRAVPYAVRQHWDNDPNKMDTLFQAWLELIAEERGGDTLDIGLYLDAQTDIERPPLEHIGPLEHTLLSLIELAVSIRTEGLTNPITVASSGLKYKLETGERRWLAYHLLHLHTQDDSYARIAARTVNDINIWRQAAENNARANLNAISKARQLAVLLMDLRREHNGDQFEPFDSFEDEQAYYAQVADGNTYKAPKNTSERLLSAMGLKHAKQLRDYRALLKLPPLVWQIADDLNWTEYFIRNLRDNEAGGDEALLVQVAVRKARAEGYTAPVGAVPEAPARKSTRKKRQAEEIPAPGSRQYYTHFSRLMRKTGPGKERANREAIKRVQEFKRWLDEQEKQLKKYLDE